MPRPGQAFAVFLSIVRPVRPSAICGRFEHIHVESGSTCIHIIRCTCNQSVVQLKRCSLDLEYVCLLCFFAVLVRRRSNLLDMEHGEAWVAQSWVYELWGSALIPAKNVAVCAWQPQPTE